MSASEKIKETPKLTDHIKVLIADDDPPTRILLRAAISQWGYEVAEADNGETAWQMLQQPDAPRLLIVDWLMPKLDGVSLCRRIKQEHNLHTYTILLTQVSGTTNIIKGLEAGADEFLSKPFNMAELRSRLSVGARIIKFEKDLAEQTQKVHKYDTELDTLSQSYAKRLVYHSDLLVMLGSLIENISQEISVALKTDKKNTSTSKTNTTDNVQNIEELRLNLSKVIELIKRLQVNSPPLAKTAVCQVNGLIQATLNLCQSATRHMKIELDLASKLPSISTDPDQLQEIFIALILSTAEATKNQEHPYLRINTKCLNDKSIEISIEDSGKQFSENELKLLLQPKIQLNHLDQIRSRLSINMSKESLQKYGGSLSLENQANSGIRLCINLPIERKQLGRAE